MYQPQVVLFHYLHYPSLQVKVYFNIYKIYYILFMLLYIICIHLTGVASLVGAYARIRKQFKVPIAEMEGVQESLG